MTNIPIEPVPNYQQIAEEIIALLRAALQKMPGFTTASPARRRKISVTASLSDEIFNSVALTCDAQPHIAAATGQITGEKIRAAIRYSDAFQAVVKELDLLRGSALDTINENRAEVAIAVRKIYKVAKGVSSPEEKEAMVPHMAAIRAAFKRPKRAVTAKAPEPGSPDGTTPAPVAKKR